PAAGGLTSHVLDTALGRPAAGVAITLEVTEAPAAQTPGAAWTVVATAVTDQDGRARDLLAGGALEARVYRLTFDTGAYFRAAGRPVFYPRVQIEIAVRAPGEPHHV